jgi:hypothetical protein
VRTGSSGATIKSLIESDITSISTLNGDSVVPGSSQTDLFDTIIITLDPAIAAALYPTGIGKVEANGTSLTGINGNPSDEDSVVLFKQK